LAFARQPSSGCGSVLLLGGAGQMQGKKELLMGGCEAFIAGKTKEPLSF